MGANDSAVPDLRRLVQPEILPYRAERTTPRSEIADLGTGALLGADTAYLMFGAEYTGNNEGHHRDET